MTPLEPELPPGGEEIHLPGPSIQPLLLAFGITIAIVGITTFFVLVISLIHAFQVFDTVQVMTGGGPADASRTMVVFIYDQGFRFLKMGYAAAVAWVLFIFIFLVTLAQWQLQKRWVSYD